MRVSAVKACLLILVTLAVFAVADTRLYEKTIRPDGYVELKPVDVTRSPKTLSGIGRTKILTKMDDNVSVTNTAWEVISGMSVTFNADGGERILILVNVYGNAPSGGQIRLSLFLDDDNIVGNGGLSGTDATAISCLNIAGITAVLDPGQHTIDLRTKVSNGTGTILAKASTHLPLIMTLMSIAGEF